MVLFFSHTGERGREKEREVKTGVATACIVLVHEQDTSSGKLVMPIQADSLRSRKVALIQ